MLEKGRWLLSLHSNFSFSSSLMLPLHHPPPPPPLVIGWAGWWHIGGRGGRTIKALRQTPSSHRQISLSTELWTGYLPSTRHITPPDTPAPPAPACDYVQRTNIAAHLLLGKVLEAPHMEDGWINRIWHHHRCCCCCCFSFMIFLCEGFGKWEEKESQCSSCSRLSGSLSVMHQAAAAAAAADVSVGVCIQGLVQHSS